MIAIKLFINMFDWYACTVPSGAACLRKSADILVKPWVRLCYSIYVTFSKVLLLCSACNDQAVVSKILDSKTEAKEKLLATMLKTQTIYT